MYIFGLILVIACTITNISTDNYNHLDNYRPFYSYDLTLRTGNHMFPFKGLTKITLNRNNQNLSYSNLTGYGKAANYTKQVILDFSLSNVKSITIEWDYKWYDFPKYLLYKPLLFVDSFTIIPIYDKATDGQRYRWITDFENMKNTEARSLSKEEELDNLAISPKKLIPYYPYKPNMPIYASNKPLKPIIQQVGNRPVDIQIKPYTSNQYQAKREKPIRFCPVNISDEGIDAKVSTLLIRCLKTS